MKQFEFNRRMLLKSATAMAAVGAVGSFGLSGAQAAGPLKLWTIGIAKVGAKDWSAVSAHCSVISLSSASVRFQVRLVALREPSRPAWRRLFLVMKS